MLGISRTFWLALALAWMLVGILVTALWLVESPGIEITWQTETEFGSAGFNLLRSEVESGPYMTINDRLIPASNDAAAGADYVYDDSDVVAGQRYFYQLEDIDLSGNATRHTPVSFTAPGRTVWLLAIGVISLLIGAALATSAWSSGRQRKTL